jgi:Domain of unknown function (DUF222)/HNH endonuclease
MFDIMDGLHPANQILEARAAVRLDTLEQLEVGPALHAGLVELRAVPIGSQTAVRASVLWGKLIAHCQAQQMITTTDAVNNPDRLILAASHESSELIGEELAALTHVSSGTSCGQVRFTEYVGDNLALSWEALDRGDLTLQHLQYLTRATTGCTPALVQIIDSQLIPPAIARGWTPAKLATEARKAVITLDPDGAADRATKAKTCADVILIPGPNECATLIGDGDAVTLTAIKAAIDTRAAQLVRDATEPLPIGLARIRAMAQLILDPDQHARRPRYDGILTIDLTTWLGITQQPGELTGYGPISPATARALAADTSFRVAISDPDTADLLALGHTRYRPSARLTSYIQARDRTCQFPGCQQPAVRCDLDHRREHNRGGPTDPDNLQPLCRRHHNLKTHKLWRTRRNPDSTQTWTSPLGFTHTPDHSTYQVNAVLEPPDDGDQPPEQIGNRLPEHPDEIPHPRIDDPLPEAPTITLEEYLAYSDNLERHTFWNVNRHYDQHPHLHLAS